MYIDSRTQWLVVVVLPAVAFSDFYARKAMEVDARVDSEERAANENWTTIITVCIAGCVGTAFVSLCIALATTWLIVRPMDRLCKQMHKLGKLDFVHNTIENQELKNSCCRVREVCNLQEGFCHLSRSIEVFARHVPLPVVRQLVQGDQRAARLHVQKRNVTIMFSDIRDFTTISEGLSQKDLLYVLTAYLTVMTRIIESLDGVVGEVLGDGLLCFWNTPDDVEDHAVKACTAALQQHQALGPLNKELEKDGLPKLAIRIGLHTGEVLTGNIGSVSAKMKFGCMGDPVNLASRLEGLCKVYGVGILCSGDTLDAVGSQTGFVTRKLDLVQVKGKQKPTLIYELIGCNQPRGVDLEPVPPERLVRARMYEEALHAYQSADFEEAGRLAETLVKSNTEGDDIAAVKLLERAKGYQNANASGFWSFLPMGMGASPLSAEDFSAWTGVVKMTDK